MQSVVEINTGVCDTVDDVQADLSGKLQVVENACDRLGLRLFWGATHPFSHWEDQEVTPNERYQSLVICCRKWPGD